MILRNQILQLMKIEHCGILTARIM